ncbi:MAG: type 1 glutamine amidotransferase domain-containing protein [Chloroflexota bacterium]
MPDNRLQGLRVAILVADDFEQVELTEPLRALREAGARVDIVSPEAGKVQGMHHDEKADKFPVDVLLDGANPDEYDALVLPGGALNPDRLRTIDKALSFVRSFDEAGKPIAVICHGPWTLVSAGLVNGRTLTSWPSLKDDVKNAGGNWVDREVVVDGNWVSSRWPSDLPVFNREMLNLFANYYQQRRAA